MARKKIKKKENKKEVVESNLEKPIPRKVKAIEEKTLFWTLLFIVLAFAAFLIPYYYVSNTKTFEYLGLEWFVDKEPDITFYHARFPFFDGRNVIHNLYLTNDPRKNNVEAVGEFNIFRRNMIVSFSPEANFCGNEVYRAYLTMGSFLMNPVGVNELHFAFNDEEVASQREHLYADCSTSETGGSIIIIETGEENFVRQDEQYPYCHIITVADCSDGRAVEKFILKVLEAGLSS